MRLLSNGNKPLKPKPIKEALTFFFTSLKDVNTLQTQSKSCWLDREIIRHELYRCFLHRRLLVLFIPQKVTLDWNGEAI